MGLLYITNEAIVIEHGTHLLLQTKQARFGRVQQKTLSTKKNEHNN